MLPFIADEFTGIPLATFITENERSEKTCDLKLARFSTKITSSTYL
jgi:hypothetical protein